MRIVAGALLTEHSPVKSSAMGFHLSTALPLTNTVKLWELNAPVLFAAQPGVQLRCKHIRVRTSGSASSYINQKILTDVITCNKTQTDFKCIIHILQFS